MQSILFTEAYCQPELLFPFTGIRAVQDIRVGILTIREKWEHWLRLPSFDKWEDDYKDNERSVKINKQLKPGAYLLIHSNVLPSAHLVKAIRALKAGEFLMTPDNGPIAFLFSEKQVLGLHRIKVLKEVVYDKEVRVLSYPWQITAFNDAELRTDFALLTRARRSQKASKTNTLICPENIFMEKGVSMEHCILNATDGPIFIAKEAVLMEGCLVRGPFALGAGAVLKMGTRIYGATSLGPSCVVGGEIKNTVIFGYSNKAHDGYLGDAVIGEWCNLGAGTSCSNVKNTGSAVKVWNQGAGQYMEAGQKCGLLMGDYSRCAINTSFNTGTVVGICAHVFNVGLTPKFIPSFSWGSEGVNAYALEKALQDIENWKQMKGKTITPHERSVLLHIANH
jgi:UDP-N-acetylglucosamine diphosphorylase / glucose-1-phosphate thymidylyltransferase / UDP-N-acetylgalactosamine diphosphorylase / glucosamine-1-phosphate N-acetyltransferase / galactosamine-1-phosphate N-acetyltransferase